MGTGLPHSVRAPRHRRISFPLLKVLLTIAVYLLSESSGIHDWKRLSHHAAPAGVRVGEQPLRTHMSHANTATDRAYRPMISAVPPISTPGELLGLGSSHHSKARRAKGISTNPVTATLIKLPIKVATARLSDCSNGL